MCSVTWQLAQFRKFSTTATNSYQKLKVGNWFAGNHKFRRTWSQNFAVCDKLMVIFLLAEYKSLLLFDKLSLRILWLRFYGNMLRIIIKIHIKITNTPCRFWSELYLTTFTIKSGYIRKSMTNTDLVASRDFE